MLFWSGEWFLTRFLVFMSFWEGSQLRKIFMLSTRRALLAAVVFLFSYARSASGKWSDWPYLWRTVFRITQEFSTARLVCPLFPQASPHSSYILNCLEHGHYLPIEGILLLIGLVLSIFSTLFLLWHRSFHFPAAYSNIRWGFLLAEVLNRLQRSSLGPLQISPSLNLRSVGQRPRYSHV